MRHLSTRVPLPQLAAAVCIGLLLRFVVGLEPVWWLAWIAPAPLLVLAFTRSARSARWLTALAALIGASANFHYFLMVMPLPASLLAVLGQALLWVFVVGASRRIVLAVPVLVDRVRLSAAVGDGRHADGDPAAGWELGQPGVFSVRCAGNIASDIAVRHRRPAVPPGADPVRTGAWPGVRQPPAACALGLRHAGALLAAALGYGEFRLQEGASGVDVPFGLVAIDDAIGPLAAPAYAKISGAAMSGRWRRWPCRARM